jgi:hypothetical protein
VRKESQVRKPYGFEIEPEVREWLDNLSDSDFKRVDEVAGLLAEKGASLAVHGRTIWKDRSGNCGFDFAMLQPG